MSTEDEVKELPLHKACRGGHGEIIEYILEKDLSKVSKKNKRNELSIHLLCSKEDIDEGVVDSPEYVESIWNYCAPYPDNR